MIAAIVHVSFRTTAGPAEALRPVLKELLFAAFELGLKFTFKIVGFLKEYSD